jgi:hypothetical protein
VLSGDAGNDALSGGGAGDALLGGAGSYTFNGGAGFDLASYFFASASVQVDLSTGTATGEGTTSSPGSRTSRVPATTTP